jgi:hypothetical protein
MGAASKGSSPASRRRQSHQETARVQLGVGNHVNSHNPFAFPEHPVTICRAFKLEQLPCSSKVTIKIFVYKIKWFSFDIESNSSRLIPNVWTAAPLRCGSGPSGPEPSGWLINQLGNPSFMDTSEKESFFSMSKIYLLYCTLTSIPDIRTPSKRPSLLFSTLKTSLYIAPDVEKKVPTR